MKNAHTFDFPHLRQGSPAAKGAFAPAQGEAQITHFMAAKAEKTGVREDNTEAMDPVMVLRLPLGLFRTLKRRAERSDRSLSAEICATLESAICSRKCSHTKKNTALRERYTHIHATAGSRRKAVRHG